MADEKDEVTTEDTEVSAASTEGEELVSKKFWVVWNPLTRNTIQCASEELAVESSEREAAKSPGYKYYVLKPLSFSESVNQVVTEEIE